MGDTRRRVKLYALNADRQWDDRGTGHVSSSYIERLQGMSLLVRAESDGSLLLESKILPDTTYQKQQETLIVWSEGDNFDLALSFQERAGCDEIWAKICLVQGKDPSVDITQDITDEEDDRYEEERVVEAFGLGVGHGNSGASGHSMGGIGPGANLHLPPCEQDRLEEISEMIAQCLPYPMKRERLAIALETEDYIRKLLALFRTAESAGQIKALHKLYEIVKNIFLLNKNPLFEVMLAEENLWDVIGVFEYDPATTSATTLTTPSQQSGSNGSGSSSSSPSSASSSSSSPTSSSPTTAAHSGAGGIERKRHREYLRQVSRFKEVIQFANRELINKIHQTYRVQYIQDVVLPTPSVFEENMLSTLSSFIFFNKCEIVTLIQEDERFLRQLFSQLSDPATPTDRRRDLVLFLKEFCSFSQTLQPPSRENFFKTLSNLGIISAIEVLLAQEDQSIKTSAVDILTYLVEFNASMIREYSLAQANGTLALRNGAPVPTANNHHANNGTEEDQFLMNVIIEQMILDQDLELGMATQLAGIIKLLVDPENMLSAVVNKSEKTDYLNFFYRHCMHVLVAPILANTTNDTPPSQDNRTAQLLSIILELLSFFVEHHAYHIRNYILHHELLRRVLVLMKSKHTFLVLSSLRFLRKIIGLKDEFYHRHVITHNLFEYVMTAFQNNGGRYNLLDSAIIELFEFVRTEEIKSLCHYIITNFGPTLDKIDYVRTFKGLRLQHEQQQDRIRERESLDRHSEKRDFRFRPGLGNISRVNPIDDDDDEYRREELWFSTEDDDEEDEDDAVGNDSDSPSHANPVAATSDLTSVSSFDQTLPQTDFDSHFGRIGPRRLDSERIVETDSTLATQSTPLLIASNEADLDVTTYSAASSTLQIGSILETEELEKGPPSAGTSSGSAQPNSPISRDETPSPRKSLVDYDENSDSDPEDKENDDENSSASTTNSDSSKSASESQPSQEPQGTQITQSTWSNAAENESSSEPLLSTSSSCELQQDLANPPHDETPSSALDPEPAAAVFAEKCKKRPSQETGGDGEANDVAEAEPVSKRICL